jgi:hypothetical protein
MSVQQFEIVPSSKHVLQLIPIFSKKWPKQHTILWSLAVFPTLFDSQRVTSTNRKGISGYTSAPPISSSVSSFISFASFSAYVIYSEFADYRLGGVSVYLAFHSLGLDVCNFIRRLKIYVSRFTVVEHVNCIPGISKIQSTLQLKKISNLPAKTVSQIDSISILLPPLILPRCLP